MLIVIGDNLRVLRTLHRFAVMRQEKCFADTNALFMPYHVLNVKCQVLYTLAT